MWAPGTMGVNLSGQHEQVLTGAQPDTRARGIRELASRGWSCCSDPIQLIVNLYGDVYGMEDFEARMGEASREAFDHIIREQEEHA